MGNVKHYTMTIIASINAHKELDIIHHSAVTLFGSLVTPMIWSEYNGYKTFFIAPDSGKEAWDESEEYKYKRNVLANQIDGFAYSDGSNSIKFMIISHDECGEITIERQNKGWNNKDDTQMMQTEQKL